MSAPVLPPPVSALASALAGLPGVRAVVLGGSRATGDYGPDSDWDLGVYYRAGDRALDPEDVRRLGYDGHVSELGEWGPIVHGGGWLTAGGIHVDVLFRDLDTIEEWIGQAHRGRFDVLVQPGYIVGAPTYLPMGELAVCRPIHGEIDHPAFPPELRDAASAVWQGKAGAALMFAEGYAGIGDVACCAGMLTDAVLCTAHARLAARQEWVLNEKRLITRAGLDAAQDLLSHPGSSSTDLTAAVSGIAELVHIEPARKGT